MRIFLTLIAFVGLLAGACSDGTEMERIDASADTTVADETTTTEERTATTRKQRPTTTTTRVPPTTTTTLPKAGTAASPDPLGTPYEVTSEGSNGKETWTVKVDSVNFDGWPAIQAENQFNAAPPEGWRFILIQASVQYMSGEVASHPGYVFGIEATGSGNTVYDEFAPLPNGESGCGVIPNDLSYASELMPGGGASGNICLAVPDAEIVDGSLRLLLEPAFSFDSKPIWVTPFA